MINLNGRSLDAHLAVLAWSVYLGLTVLMIQGRSCWYALAGVGEEVHLRAGCLQLSAPVAVVAAPFGCAVVVAAAVALRQSATVAEAVAWRLKN